MPEPISFQGRVEMVEGQLTLRIPLSIGGDKLAPLTPSGTINGDYLCVVIPPWLAEKLRIAEGSWVVVDNTDGKFRITRSGLNDLPDAQS